MHDNNFFRNRGKIVLGSMLTSAIWILATFLTPPDDEQTLKKFVNKINDCEIQIQAMEFVELRIFSALSAGQRVGPESSILKTRGTEIGQLITELAVEVVDYYAIPFNNPGPGIGHNEPPIGSAFANSSAPRYFNYRKASIYAGSNEIQRNIMAKLVLGLT